MKLLLDTHTLLWFLAGESKLRISAREAILNPGSKVWVSAVTGLEIAIKSALGKLRLPATLPQVMRGNGFHELPMSMEHALYLTHLPPHHADPFDRVLIAQAAVEGLTLVTADSRLARYPIAILPA